MMEQVAPSKPELTGKTRENSYRQCLDEAETCREQARLAAQRKEDRQTAAATAAEQADKRRAAIDAATAAIADPIKARFLKRLAAVAPPPPAPRAPFLKASAHV